MCLTEQGADKLREAIANATSFGGAADEKLIQTAREFDREVSTLQYSSSSNQAGLPP
jgi:hypothetical protein